MENFRRIFFVSGLALFVLVVLMGVFGDGTTVLAQTAALPPAQAATPTPAPVDATTPITQTAPAPDADNLVLLIDTLVHYGAWFLLGLGIILLGVLILFFLALARRSRNLTQRQGPPQ